MNKCVQKSEHSKNVKKSNAIVISSSVRVPLKKEGKLVKPTVKVKPILKKISIVQKSSNTRFEGHCYYCAVWGHMARHCWWRYPVQAPGTTIKTSRRNLYHTERKKPIRSFCTYCQKQGHDETLCWWKPDRKNYAAYCSAQVK